MSSSSFKGRFYTIIKKSRSLLVGCRLGPRISTPARRSRNVDRLLPRLVVAAVVPPALSLLERADAPRRGCKHRSRREAHANQSPRRALEVAPGHTRRDLREARPEGSL